MTKKELEIMAYDEAQRLLEKDFSFNNPYTCIIEIQGIPFTQVDDFCQMVENELLKRGEKIKRDGVYFKILRYN